MIYLINRKSSWFILLVNAYFNKHIIPCVPGTLL